MNDRLKKYIGLREIPHVGKTKKWEMYLLKTGETVAKIYWYGGWRKYVVELYATGFYDTDFLREAADLCEQKNQEHNSI